MRHMMTGVYGPVTLGPLREEEIEALRLLRNRNRDRFVFFGEVTSEGRRDWYTRYLAPRGTICFPSIIKTDGLARWQFTMWRMAARSLAAC